MALLDLEGKKDQFLLVPWVISHKKYLPKNLNLALLGQKLSLQSQMIEIRVIVVS